MFWFTALQLWNIKTTECLQTFKPSVMGSVAEVTINSIQLWPRNVDQFIVCDRSNTACVMNMQGQVCIAKFAAGGGGIFGEEAYPLHQPACANQLLCVAVNCFASAGKWHLAGFKLYSPRLAHSTRRARLANVHAFGGFLGRFVFLGSLIGCKNIYQWQARRWRFQQRPNFAEVICCGVVTCIMYYSSTSLVFASFLLSKGGIMVSGLGGGGGATMSPALYV